MNLQLFVIERKNTIDLSFGLCVFYTIKGIIALKQFLWLHALPIHVRPGLARFERIERQQCLQF